MADTPAPQFQKIPENDAIPAGWKLAPARYSIVLAGVGEKIIMKSLPAPAAAPAAAEPAQELEGGPGPARNKPRRSSSGKPGEDYGHIRWLDDDARRK